MMSEISAIVWSFWTARDGVGVLTVGHDSRPGPSRAAMHVTQLKEILRYDIRSLSAMLVSLPASLLAFTSSSTTLTDAIDEVRFVKSILPI